MIVLQKGNKRLKQKRLHLRVNKDTPRSSSSSDTESSSDPIEVDPKYGKYVLQIVFHYLLGS